MADRRTKREKLEAMAAQSVSPHEAEIARQKLAAQDRPLGRKTSPKYVLSIGGRPVAFVVTSDFVMSNHFSDDS